MMEDDFDDRFLVPVRTMEISDTEFWCSICDGNKVHSNKPDTGRFFSQFGHLWSVDKQKTSEQYTQVVFAVCTSCLDKANKS